MGNLTLRRLALLIVPALLVLVTAVLAQNSWKALPNAPVTPRRFDDAFFIDDSTGWIVSEEGEIYKTRDAGQSWQLQFTTNALLRSVGFADAQTGWVGTLNRFRVLLTTTDGGESWGEVQNLPAPLPSGICGIWVVNESVVYASGVYTGPAILIKTTDGGKNWTSIDLTSNDGPVTGLIDCYFPSADVGFVVGYKGTMPAEAVPVILYTSDGGKTWINRYTGTRLREWCWKISFPSEQVGYVSIESNHPGPSYFLKTTDGGLTWQDKVFTVDFYRAQGIGFATERIGWIGGAITNSFETTDGGETWRAADVGLRLNRFRTRGPGLAYAVGLTAYKWSPSQPSTVGGSGP